MSGLAKNFYLSQEAETRVRIDSDRCHGEQHTIYDRTGIKYIKLCFIDGSILSKSTSLRLLSFIDKYILHKVL
jgi:hypothetical protein